jgi:hypothetical protein
MNTLEGLLAVTGFETEIYLSLAVDVLEINRNLCAKIVVPAPFPTM